MLATAKNLFNHCYGMYGIAGINVFTLEQVVAVFHAADKCDSPVIIQTTPASREYAGAHTLTEIVRAVAETFPNTIYCLHLDHGNESHVSDGINSGKYSSVMIDASHDTFQNNVNRTRRIIEMAHNAGISVEAELGVLSGVEDDMEIEKEMTSYTRPEDAVRFVRETDCDSLAIAIGTSHGAYKFTGRQKLRTEILQMIQAKLPGFPLVLHGGSAIDADEIRRINAAGGKLRTGSRGLSNEELRMAISLGICKVNIATDLRILWTRVHREFFASQPDKFDPTVPGRTYMEELITLCKNKFKLLGSAGQANSLRKSLKLCEEI